MANYPPQNGKDICDYVLVLIEQQTGPRPLTEDAKEAFTYAPGSVGRMNNKNSFQRVFDESSWEAEGPAIEEAARLHGRLCHHAAVLRDGKNAPRPIDSELLEAAGRVVRLVCAAGEDSEGLRMASAGTWCSWP
jgi:hypothetical protein